MLPPRRKVDPARVAELHARGLTDPQIARAIACATTSVRTVRHLLNLAPNVSSVRDSQRAAGAVAKKKYAARCEALSASLALPPIRSALALRAVERLASGPLPSRALAAELGVDHQHLLYRALPPLRKSGVIVTTVPPRRGRGSSQLVYSLSPSLFSRTALTPLQQRVAATPRAVSAAEYQIAKYAPNFPHFADDIRSAAYAALADAARLFDPSRVQFHTYAPRRIQGAIRDALRNAMPLGYRRKSDAVTVGTGFYQAASTPLDFVPDAARASVLESLDSFAHLTRVLPPQSREVLRLMFVHDLTAAEIGPKLNLSVSRVFQIRQAALAQLAESLVAPNSSPSHLSA